MPTPAPLAVDAENIAGRAWAYEDAAIARCDARESERKRGVSMSSERVCRSYTIVWHWNAASKLGRALPVGGGDGLSGRVMFFRIAV